MEQLCMVYTHTHTHTHSMDMDTDTHMDTRIWTHGH